MKSAGVVIGWNENLHTLGPPWHMIGHPCSTPSKALTTHENSRVLPAVETCPTRMPFIF